MQQDINTNVTSMAEMAMRNVPKNLKFLRQLKGVSKSKAAFISGMSRRRYSSIEKGLSYPDIITVCILAEHYNINIMLLIEHDLEKEWGLLFTRSYSGNGSESSNTRSDTRIDKK